MKGSFSKLDADSNKPHLTLVKGYVKDLGINDLIIHSSEVAVSKEQERGDIMDRNTEKILDRLDQDLRDHKKEIQDRDKRILDDSREREQRYREEMAIQNKLFREEAKEREERMEKMVSSLSSEIKEIKGEFSQTTKHVQSLVTTNFWGFIATIIAIVALVITVVLTK